MFRKTKKKSIRYIALILAVLQIFSIPLGVYASEESKESENLYTMTTSIEEVVQEENQEEENITLENESVLEIELKETLILETETVLENRQDEENQEDIILESESILEVELKETQEHSQEKRILDDIELLESLKANRSKQVNIPAGEGTGYVSIGAGIPQNALIHAKLNDYGENAIEARLQYAKTNDLLDWIDENGYLIDAYLYGRGFNEWRIHSLLVRTGESAFGNGISLFTVASETPIHDADGPSSVFYVANEHGTNLAYCGYWNAPTPPAGTATYSPVEVIDSIVKKIVYYGNGGDGYGIYTNASWSQTTWAISGGYYARENYFSGIENWADVPANFKVYRVDTPGAYQPLIYGLYEAQPQNGSLELRKESTNPIFTNGNSSYSLAGAIYEVFDLTTKAVLAMITLDSTGYGRVDNLPEGQYGVREKVAPKGYHLNPREDRITIVKDKTTSLTVYNTPIDDPISIVLMKMDSAVNRPIEGAEFTIKYYDVQSSTDPALAGHTAKKIWVLKTDADGFAELNATHLVSGDSFYKNASGAITIPLGTITIQETKALDKYIINDEVFVREIKEGSVPGTVVAYSVPIIPNTPFSAKVSVNKVDSNTNEPLEGASFKIQYWSESQNTYMDTSSYTMTYNSTTKMYESNNLYADIHNLGKFKIIEETNPQGYAGEWEQEIVITEATQIFTYTASNDPFNGKIYIRKIDDETEQTLKGAEFKIYVWSEAENTYQETNEVMTYNNTTERYESGTLYYTLDNLGKYKVVETKNPTGFLGEWEREITLSNVNQGFGMTAVNNSIRGDVEIIKFKSSSNTNETYVGLEGVEFTFTDKETGEVIVKITTDGNGFATTADPAFPRGRLRYGTYIVTETVVPAGMKPIAQFEVTISEEGQVIQGIYKENIPYEAGIQLVKIDSETGNNIALAGTTFQILDKDKNIIEMTQYYPEFEALTEFITNENGWCFLPEKLQLGTYYIRELLAPQDYLLGEDIRFVVDKEYTWENPLVIKIANTPVKGKVDITKVDAETKEKLAGAVFNIVARDDVYTADGTLRVSKGEIVDTLITDINGYAQSKELYLGNYYAEEIASPFGYGLNLEKHEFGLIYKNQETAFVYASVEVENFHSKIKTSAFDQHTGKKEGFAQEITTLIDIVAYTDLIVGKEHVIDGILMDFETNSPFLVNGKEITAQVTFIPASPNGEIEIIFTFDGSDLKGKKIVVFETLSRDGKKIYVHHDINDKEQTVTYKAPKIGTTASDIATDSNTGMIRKLVTIRDLVAFKDLIIGNTYRVKGILMEPDTGLPFLDNGELVTSEVTFIAKQESGTVSLDFLVNGEALRGKTVVVFETLYYEELELAVHHDLNDERQTVIFPNPQIGTTATNKAGGKTLAYGKIETIIDLIKYDGLTAGKEYDVEGVLMDKSTGKPLLINGEEVIAKAAFIPETSSGTVEIVFSLDTTNLAGKEIVVFETLYHEGFEIALHADIEDEGQTVRVENPIIPPKTSDSNKIELLTGMMLTMLALVLFLTKRKKYGR